MTNVIRNKIIVRSTPTPTPANEDADPHPNVIPFPHPTCPACATHMTPGYGLAAGGIGAYWLCETCGFMEAEGRTPPTAA